MMLYTRHPDFDFTYLVSESETTIEDWLETIEKYRSEGLTKRELYDLRYHRALYSNEEIEKIIEVAVANRAMHTTERKTAIVVTNPSQFGLSRMYELKSEVEGVPTKLQVFYRVDEAIQWLGNDVAVCIPNISVETGAE